MILVLMEIYDINIYIYIYIYARCSAILTLGQKHLTDFRPLFEIKVISKECIYNANAFLHRFDFQFELVLTSRVPSHYLSPKNNFASSEVVAYERSD